MHHFDSPYLTITWDVPLQSVVMEWRRFVSGDDFRNGLDKGLDLLIQQRAHRWLVDLRNLGVVTQEDQQWSNETWFPRAIAGGITAMAIVLPHDIIARWSVDRIMSKVEGTRLVVHHFDALDAARQWLQQQ